VPNFLFYYLVLLHTLVIKIGEYPHGDNTIQVRIYLWTDELPKDIDKKTAWSSGTLALKANKSRGIRSCEIKFNNENEFLEKVNEILQSNDIKLMNYPDHEHVKLK